MRSKLFQLTALIFWLIASAAYALPGDENQPIYISADSASINEKSGVTTYKGNVIIKQGSLLIEAAKVEMYRNDNGIERLIATGQPAHFRQKPAHDSPYSDAWGMRMEYLPEASKLTITKAAKVVQENDSFSGEKIVYDLNKSIVDAFGSASASDSSGSGRVNMVIQPKPKSSEKR